MRVSVVIPAFNAEDLLPKALASVFAQTRPPDEIIVIDDGSADGTAALAASYASRGVRLLQRENGGPGRARNTGIAEASGDLIAFLDTDDLWLPDMLERLMSAFARHPTLIAAAGTWSWMPGGPLPAGEPVPLFLRADEWQRPLPVSKESRLRVASSMACGALIVQRAALLQCPFDPALPTAEDRDVWMRLAGLGEIWFEPGLVLSVASRPNSQSNSDATRDCLSMLALLERFRNEIPDHQRQAWQTRTYGKWAGRLLSIGRGREALRPATIRLLRCWWSPRAWWILGKCLWCALREPAR